MQLNINEQVVDVAAAPGELLLWVLRDELGLIGTRYGCGMGFCGACTVHVDGVATRACLTPVGSVEGKRIRTIEGLATEHDDGTLTLHPVQQAFVDTQAPQCAWCMSGQMMTAAAFLEQNPGAGEAEIVEAMSGNYCRCGCYVRIKAAVAQAGQQMLAARQEQELAV